MKQSLTLSWTWTQLTYLKGQMQVFSNRHGIWDSLTGRRGITRRWMVHQNKAKKVMTCHDMSWRSWRWWPWESRTLLPSSCHLPKFDSGNRFHCSGHPGVWPVICTGRVYSNNLRTLTPSWALTRIDRIKTTRCELRSAVELSSFLLMTSGS